MHWLKASSAPWSVAAWSSVCEPLIPFHPFLEGLEPLEESNKEKTPLDIEESNQWKGVWQLHGNSLY